MKRKFTVHPVVGSQSAPPKLTVSDVLECIRNDSEFLLETPDAVYLSDPSASTYPGVLKLSHRNISKTISAAIREWGNDVTAQEIVDDWIYMYGTHPGLNQLIAAYQAAGQEVPEELLT